ncbi:hypothetical protein AM493_15125 [Flavobacterium akiainvivens]|uniref:Uncharacterized protein n=1 Tax=Flavobacterium akiainvivens TaxID=1202724 RepID=A0A0M8MK74_9FLAO|nr:hypothetical protein AM493_15125 [Flavobacterium akiainvivens]SFQ45185.1 hypothetical protein SAMN05444144_1055 [Flavobacterium akiainvivens]
MLKTDSTYNINEADQPRFLLPYTENLTPKQQPKPNYQENQDFSCALKTRILHSLQVCNKS